MAIQIVVKEIEVQPAIPEGVYKAAVIKIDEGTGEYGDYLKFMFEIIDGEHKGVAKTLVASKKLSSSKSGKNSKLLDIVKALTKTEPKAGETLDIESLIGKSCQIVVKDGKEKDGVTYQNINTVLPI
jgi:hypothetical protein